jgi:hypothetical protein
VPLQMKAGPASTLLRTLLHYDAETGALSRSTTKGGRLAGTRVGNVERAGYRVAKIGGQTYKEHRLIWAYVTGAWPVEEIDHIDGDKTNNRIANLRAVSRVGNAQNLRRGRGKSPLLGAHWNGEACRWRSKIVCRGESKFLGYFDTPEEAHEAYLRAKRELHNTCEI